MSKIKERFTRWYYRKGYRMHYKPCAYGDGVDSLVFDCPWWIKPLLIFFSPSVYYIEYGKTISDWFEEGFSQGLETKGKINGI